LDNKVINYYWSVMSGLRCIELENRGVLTVAGHPVTDLAERCANLRLTETETA